ncbi:hypothetical protein CDAR_593691 [Caerostris darwini]|uniref:Secreted protein n=1 Tax=Caerostris darwini TaxID=1538125 RepID=A0AAV4VR78_9ARAC|nr:hypothetical protein CDAR_593691 [Caerostris darwini]
MASHPRFLAFVLSAGLGCSGGGGARERSQPPPPTCRRSLLTLRPISTCAFTLQTLRPTKIGVPMESLAGSPGGVQVRRRPGQVGEAHPHLVSVTR